MGHVFHGPRENRLGVSRKTDPGGKKVSCPEGKQTCDDHQASHEEKQRTASIDSAPKANKTKQ